MKERYQVDNEDGNKVHHIIVTFFCLLHQQKTLINDDHTRNKEMQLQGGKCLQFKEGEVDKVWRQRLY